MAEVFVLSYYLPTQPTIEVPLFNELVSRNIKTNFVMLDDDPRLNKDALLKLPESIILIQNPKQLNKIMKQQDLMVCRFGYKGKHGEASSAVKMSGKNVLMYDVGGVDVFFREVPATHLIAKTEWYKQQTIKKIGKKYKEIYTDGSIQFDDIFRFKNKVKKEDIMARYGLDINKKLAILTPANPGEAYMDGIKDDYKKIVEAIEQNDEFELLIKGHPSDYALTKSLHYNGKHSWEIFAPKAKVINAEEGYETLAACDLILNIRSSLAIEVPAMRKPIININSEKYTVNWPKSNNNGVMKNIKINELSKALNDKIEINESACQEYSKKYCDFCEDGNAYIRMAKIIMGIL